MLQTVEVLIDLNGKIHWLEPMNITQPTRALVTLLENGVTAPQLDPPQNRQGNAAALLALLHMFLSFAQLMF